MFFFLNVRPPSCLLTAGAEKVPETRGGGETETTSEAAGVCIIHDDDVTCLTASAVWSLSGR